MAIFKVELRETAYVEAENHWDAREIAYRESSNIVRDGDCVVWVHVAPITSLSDLEDGWDGDCLPYGDEPRNKRLSEILEP